MDEQESASRNPSPKQAFVDAYGNPSVQVEKEGVTTFFIVVAILVEGDRAAALRSEVDAVRAEYFGPGPMKSKKCTEERRLKVL